MPLIHEKTTFDYISALAPLIISAYVAWIAYQQYRTNNEKLRLDLYDRRFSIYTASLDFYHTLAAFDENNEQHMESHRVFIKAVRESRFLFGEESEAVELLEDMQQRAAGIMGFRSYAQEIRSDSDEYRTWFNKQQSDYLWMGGEDGLMRLERILAPFLDFRKAGLGKRQWVGTMQRHGRLQKGQN